MILTAKINSPEIFKGYSHHLQKQISAKYLKNVSLKINYFLGKDFIRSVNLLIPKGFLESIGAFKEIVLRYRMMLKSKDVESKITNVSSIYFA